MSSTIPPPDTGRSPWSWLSRDHIAARLAQPAVPPGELDRHVIVLPPDTRIRLAAVLVPLIPRDDEVHVLLTQRASHLKDHPSQISFPGGRVDAADASRTETALREAREEIGLQREHVRILGTLPDYDMPSGFRISPVIGWIEPPVAMQIDPVEVESTFEVPLSFLLDAANHHYRSHDLNGGLRHYLAMPYQGRYIWGATAGMLRSLHRQLAGHSG